MPRTLKAAATFWALCLLLAALEARIGSNALASTLFLLAIPVLVSYLSWIWRTLLRGRLPAPLPLLLYAGTVLGLTVLTVLLGLLSAQYLFGSA